MKMKLVAREDTESWEQVVFAEVLVPESPNTYGDFWTKEAIKEAAYMFMKEGFGIDVNHDNVDVTGDVYVVETFIARPGDPDFIEGSWVVGMKIEDPSLWQGILDGDINGYSYEAIVSFLTATMSFMDDGSRTGYTEPSPDDGHRHAFFLVVDDTGRPIEGGTDVVNGHSHTISTHTITDLAPDGSHLHRYNFVLGKDGK